MAAVALLVDAVTSPLHVTWKGFTLAAVSGALTSGLGYVLWYRALEGLGTNRAAIVQLTVPVIASAAAILFLGEPINGRLAMASIVILGGVAVALFNK